jgi:hypothetical protein
MSQISITKDGINTSVLSYISSYSISALIIVMLIFSYYFPVFGKSLQEFLPANFRMSLEVKIFCLFMLLVITYPLGLLFAWTSWTLLGFMEKYIETFHFKHNWFLTKGSKNYLCFDDLKEAYKLTDTNFYSTCREVEANLEVKDKKLIGSLDDIMGISNLIRHITLCLIILFIYYAITLNLLGIIIAPVIALLSIIVNSVVCFHFSLTVLLFNLKKKEKQKENEN